MNSTGLASELLFHAMGVLGILLDILGLIVCLRFIRLASAMPVLVFAFAAFSGAGFAFRAIQFIMHRQGLVGDSAMLIGLISLAANAVNLLGIVALVVGLYFAFRELRDRLHFLSEVQSGRDPDRAAAR
jgi:hypothetical protein